MNNETQPTPEQLAQWREAGAEAWMVDSNASTQEEHEDCYIAGYLRAKQENEQAIKDAVTNAVKTMVAAFIATLDANKVSMTQEVRSEFTGILND